MQTSSITSITKKNFNKEGLQHQLQEIFEKADHQNSALAGIYKLFIPGWEKIERLEGFPQVGKEMWCYICQLFVDFDQKHHPKVFNGGIWLNNGFSSSDKLGPWEISMDHCNVIYK
ncbi:MAG: hypothetical protein KKE62_06365 [Proteobacteria bacterium]|nr:hypothetical protein [Pseudomonadota bacterium]MBU1542453.1 hypothetical protein [Pseudomonadota bacterium]MBU2431103.1 hypothetical protein [Pseudomonadota bacterium]